jgi:gluconolactonase
MGSTTPSAWRSTPTVGFGLAAKLARCTGSIQTAELARLTTSAGLMVAANMYVSDSGGWKKNRGYILRFDRNGCGRVVGGPYGYANGLALTADERYLFMAESDTHRVLRFELLKDGALGPTETYADQVGRVPDGLVLDEEGNLFVSCYASDDIYRVSSSGQVDLFAADPNGIILSRPTNMAFGMRDRAELYVANLGGHVITRVQTSHRGQPLANQNKYAQTSK